MNSPRNKLAEDYSAPEPAGKGLPPCLVTANYDGMSDTPIKTPCVKVCFVDPKADLCVGCFRTMEELGRWTRYTDAERDSILADLPGRRDDYTARRQAGA